MAEIPPKASSAGIPATEAKKPKARVLVVDDDPVTLEVLRERLEDAGYEVVTRDAALGTSQWLAEHEPDLVILDVHMPAISGGELAALIRRSPATRSTGVILYSSLPALELEGLVGRTVALGSIAKTADAREFMMAFERFALKHRRILAERQK